MDMDTKFEEIRRVKYCVYCGGKSKHERGNFSGHGRDWDDFYNCDCEGAKKEIEFAEEERLFASRHRNELYSYQQKGRDILKKLEYNLEREDLEKKLKDLEKRNSG